MINISIERLNSGELRPNTLIINTIGRNTRKQNFKLYNIIQKNSQTQKNKSQTTINFVIIKSIITITTFTHHYIYVKYSRV